MEPWARERVHLQNNVFVQKRCELVHVRRKVKQASHLVHLSCVS